MADRSSVVFMGTPDFAVPSLRVLADIADVRLVVTQPDRPSGRGRAMSVPPVKTVATDLGIPVIQPEIVKGKNFAAHIAQARPDFIVTAAYGRILGASLLQVPHRACLNVHASILPAYRGAAPVNRAIINGDREAGVSIMQMVEALDAGPVYLIRTTEIGSDETAGELMIRLAHLGAQALAEVIETFASRVPTPQDEARVSYAPMLTKADGVVDWSKSAAEIHCHIRGMAPWPAATTFWQGSPVKIGAAQPVSATVCDAAPGTVLTLSSAGVDVSCGNGAIRLVEMQFPGKKMLHAAQFVHATPLRSGERFQSMQQ
jgi:methionyl-tRNA formyltransferase